MVQRRSWCELYLLAFVAVADATARVEIDASHQTHEVNPLYMGCHSDSGFVHQVRGWSSQMIFGESFEVPQENVTGTGKASNAWHNVVDAGTQATIVKDVENRFAGQVSQKISIIEGTGTAGLANRGLGNEGFYLVAGKEYEGYFFASSSSAVTFEVRLEDFETGSVLARQRLQHASGVAAWEQHHFKLTPSGSTNCVGIAPGSDPDVHCTKGSSASHVCVRCAGQFVVAVVGGKTPTSANLDFVWLQPGSWGRFAGLSARKDVADMHMRMGIKAIRLGGSFASVTAWPDGGGGTPPSTKSGQYYQWQKWTGPLWKRPSVGAVWNAYDGASYSLIGGWGPFEMIDYAVALGAEPIITTTSSSSPQELADLVEYCWGGSSTPMGRQRAQDGHPEPYKLRYFELGNEQYNTRFAEQVAAMNKRAIELGTPRLYYIFPDNGGVIFADVQKVKALGLGNQTASDIHVGAGGALDQAQDTLAEHAALGLADDAVVNFETNAGTHDHQRALSEATDLNAFFNAGQVRMLARTASFCHGRSGHFDAFDQAISMFLPNMTWLQPPGHVHAMITETWQPNALNATLLSEAATFSKKGNNQYCSNGPSYSDGPGATATDLACRARCEAMATCNFYEWWSDKACRTWDSCGIRSGNPKTQTTLWHRDVPALSVSSQQSDDQSVVVVRLVSQAATPTEVQVDVKGWTNAAGQATSTGQLHELAASSLAAVNVPSNVDLVAPTSKSVSVVGGVAKVLLPAFSYTVLTLGPASAGDSELLV